LKDKNSRRTTGSEYPSAVVASRGGAYRQPWGLGMDPEKFRACLMTEVGERAAELATVAPGQQGSRKDLDTSGHHVPKSAAEETPRRATSRGVPALSFSVNHPHDGSTPLEPATFGSVNLRSRVQGALQLPQAECGDVEPTRRWSAWLGRPGGLLDAVEATAIDSFAGSGRGSPPYGSVAWTICLPVPILILQARRSAALSPCRRSGDGSRVRT
jgi:hypothetical protein